MEQVIKIFENEEFGKVRTVVKDGEPWFVGKDVAECLGYSKPRNAINAHVDNEDKALAPIQGGCSKSQRIQALGHSHDFTNFEENRRLRQQRRNVYRKLPPVSRRAVP